MIIAILAFKLHVEYKRMNDQILRIVNINEEYTEWEYGYNENIL